MGCKLRNGPYYIHPLTTDIIKMCGEKPKQLEGSGKYKHIVNPNR